MLFKTIVYFFSILCALQLGFSQDLPRVGAPFVQQYKKSEYKAGNQNWSVSVSPEDGIVYTANTSGLLRFDGQQWKLFRTQKHNPLRSVLANEDGKIYTGGLGEFGYWIKTGFGTMEYTSLIHLVRDRNSLRNDEIWRIFVMEDIVFFHTFSKTYVYQHGEINTITAPFEPFLFGHQVNDKFFLEQIPSGLHLYRQNTLVPVAGKDVLVDKNIMAMLPLQESTLIATSRNGLYLMSATGQITPWNNEANELFVRYQINAGIKVTDSIFAFGTIQNGVIIINHKGELLQHINKNNGLQNNTVLSLATDRQLNLWVGLDNGVDRIDLLNPFYYYADLTGSLGTVYTSIIYDNKLYLGTNQGLFVSPWNGISKYTVLDFKLVPNSQGQVWQLIEVNGILYCGHNNGTYQVTDNRLTLISSITGGWQYYPIPNTDKLLQGNYTGISLFNTTSKPFHHIQQLDEVREPIKFITRQRDREFWIGNNLSYKRMQLDETFTKANRVETITAGLPDVPLHGVYDLRGRLVFATDSGFYRYDEVINSFQRYDELNDQLGSYAGANKILPIDRDQYWIIKKTNLAKITWGKDGLINIDSTTWAPLSGKMMAEYENIIPIGPEVDLIGLDNGFALYRPYASPSEGTLSPVISGFYNTTTELENIDPDTRIPYDRSNIRLFFSLPWYGSGAVLYQSRLKGYSDEWSDWSELGFRDFTNLSFGDYTFEVRAKLPSGQISDVTSVDFSVRRPWYFSWLAVVCYIGILMVLIYGVHRFMSARALAEQEALRQKLLKEKQEALKRESETSQRQMVEVKNRQLEKELAAKNRELANAATNIVYKNEMLNSLHDELTKIKDANGNTLKPEQLRKVNHLIEEAHNDTRDWDLFEKSFNESHEDFFKKLKAQYPTLVPNDLKLCAYLRLNMSSKEIASLLNISLRGVEIRRYRLRKKLNLEKDKNLSEFLIEL